MTVVGAPYDLNQKDNNMTYAMITIACGDDCSHKILA